MTLAQNDLGDWLQLAASIGCIGLLVAAAYGDLRRYRISNRLVGAVVLCFVVLAAAKASWAFIGWSLAAAACTFVLAAALFALGQFGGGDTKLLTAMALWTQFYDLPRFLLVMTASGGLLGVVWLIRRRRQQRSTVAAGTSNEQISSARNAREVPNKLPYGVAIAIAGIDFFLFSANSPLVGVLSAQ
jgi:prepilin peptidase CpaA